MHSKFPLRSSLISAFCAVLAVSPRASRAADSPALRPWTDYRVIMWVDDTAFQKPEKFPLFLQRLREMGVNTGMVHHDADPKPYVENHFPFYAENLVNRGLFV